MILDKIVEDKKIRLVEHKFRISMTEMRKMAEKCEAHPASFYEGLAKPGISIIGEFKKASPSLGNINSQIDLTKRIDEYNASVDCISCLTEEDHFLGTVHYLKEIREISPLPILRKDFMIDEYQFYEAKVIGANAILLITGILDDVQMKDFYQLTTELGLDALFEAHTEEQMDRALNCGAKIVGVNNRDLKNFTIDIRNSERLRRLVPNSVLFVAESGIRTAEDIDFLRKSHVNGVLIGETLMRAPDKTQMLNELRDIGSQKGDVL